MQRFYFKVILMLCLAIATEDARAEVEFSATVDRTRISQDESVSLKLGIRTDSASGSIDGLKFNAADFDEINEYTGVFVESFYENGRFGVRNNRTITKVLRPKRTGTLNITGIELRVAGTDYKAPPITIEVEPGGQGTPAPRGYGGSGVGLRGAGKRPGGTGFFVRAELDKQRIYKGEQLIVSYYLYHRVRIFNLSVDKFPELKGFLRDDLEMPVLGQRFTNENVLLDGVPYERSLLVRYAAYPLRDGKMTVDPLSLKANYYGTAQPPSGSGGEEDDPFFGFFQQMAPRIGTSRSDPIVLDVLALPEEGKPAGFSGIVGDFNVAAAVDKYEVKAGEPVSLTVKIDGRGNLASLAQPKAEWPAGLELYEAKGRAKNGKGGVSEKIFELLLIPRQPGTVKIPQLEFSFFDPVKKTYVTRATETFDIKVNPGDPALADTSSSPPASAASHGAAPPPVTSEGDLDAGAALNGVLSATTRLGQRALPALLGLLIALGLWFLGYRLLLAKRARARTYEAERARKFSQIASIASQAAGPGARAAWNDVLRAYETLASVVFDALDRLHPVGSRSHSREELGQILLNEKHLSPEHWQRCANILEFTETVRFAMGAGSLSEDLARGDLVNWLNETRLVVDEISRGPREI